MKRFTGIFIQQKIIEDNLKIYKDYLKSHQNYFPSDIQMMLNYIHEHIFECTFTIKKMKTVCGLNNNNISTTFRFTIGLSPQEYIKIHRLKAAAILLHERKLNIYLIATAIGYTEETFSKLFKKVYAESPLHYRQKVLKL